MSFTNGYAKPEIGPNSGEIIYIDRGAISRAGDQIEDIDRRILNQCHRIPI